MHALVVGGLTYFFEPRMLTCGYTIDYIYVDWLTKLGSSRENIY
jgi:hypothetical protein